MELFKWLKRIITNIYKMIKYAYIKDYKIKGQKIKYGKNKRQYYKVYNSNYLNKVTIFFIHGGGWWHGSPSIYSGIGKYFYKKGYTTVLVGYRLVPKYKYPHQIEDGFRALQHYIKNNNSYNKIVICGYSAGGEIASHLVYDKDRNKKYSINKDLLKGFISISGVLNFEECDSSYSKKLIKNYIGNEDINNINPVNLLKEKYNIPTLCVHGDSDSIINVKNSISFIDVLKNFNENTNLKIIQDAEHEYTIDMIRGLGNNNSKYIHEFIEEIENEAKITG
ncbi:alpha/beta hydrolase [Romboutsia sp.]|uniref:alpha/beta hydrolase n=1 Tax=Romboutsia sp. TaxID=1965302 RepID=UPI003F331794